MKSFDFRSGRTILLGAAAALALGSARPALAASSDDDFASALGALHNAVAGQTAAAKSNPLFRKVTQEKGPNDPLLLMQAPLINLVKNVEPSVVYLVMDFDAAPDPDADPDAKPDPKKKQKKGEATCTGFFVDSQKYLARKVIATNAHCVEKLKVGDELGIGLFAGNDDRPKMTKGKVLAYGNSANGKDVAFVELNDASLNRPALPLWSKLDVGEQVVAIGNPLGFTFSVSRGIVSAIGRDHASSQFITATQSDVAVNPGNSGGPLFNMWGSVVGINASIVSNSGGFEGISFSVPADDVVEALKQYARTGNLKIGAMQITVGVDSTTNHYEIRTVTPDGPAAAAHIQPNDQVVRIDGIDLAGLEPFAAQKAFLTHVKYMSPGEKTVIVVRRGGREITLPVTLGEPKAPEAPRPEWAPIPKKKIAYEEVVEI